MDRHRLRRAQVTDPFTHGGDLTGKLVPGDQGPAGGQLTAHDHLVGATEPRAAHANQNVAGIGFGDGDLPKRKLGVVFDDRLHALLVSRIR